MVVLVVLVALLFLMMTNKESFVEVMGFAGYKKPTHIEADKKFDYEGYTEQVAAVTATELQTMINLVQGYFKDDCVYPLETNSIKKFIKSNGENESSVAYKCAFTFMTTKGFVYGFGVQADIVDGQLLGIQTQQLGGNGEIKPYTDEIASDFTEFEMITKKNLPTLEKLKAGEKSL